LLRVAFIACGRRGMGSAMGAFLPERAGADGNVRREQNA
jgi:hypothetical protein